MQIGRIGPGLAWKDFVALRLVRRWAAARTAGADAMPALIELADELQEPREVAIALHSVLQLTESCLGRALEAECCCSPTMTPDEHALLMLIAAASPEPFPLAPAGIPHGLPGALSWAATAARIALDAADTTAPRPERCPFRSGD